MLADRLPNLISNQRMLVGGVVADHENARRLGNVLDGRVAAVGLGGGQGATREGKSAVRWWSRLFVPSTVRAKRPSR